MSNVTIQKRGKYYQYKFETAKIDGKRKFASKSGFRTKTEAEKEGIKAFNEYMNTGHDFTPSDMSYSDLLDYWIKNHCYINLKYHTIEAYSSIGLSTLFCTIFIRTLFYIQLALNNQVNYVF